MDREQDLVQRIAIIKQTGNRLIELVRPEFPEVLERTAPEHRLAQIALLARMTGTMEAILHVAQLRREADLSVLLRVLLDHTIVLRGWLSIQTPTIRSGRHLTPANASRSITSGSAGGTVSC